tara:strand:+ start:276 stop:1193 length:918 start_codon:yes stop_codon:yes gene_type:complete
MPEHLPVPLIRGRIAKKALPQEPKPRWLRVKAPGSKEYIRLKNLIRRLELNTVCAEANCPNVGECWDQGTATFMILGDICTRACGYCNVVHGSPKVLDKDEPNRLSEAVAQLGLQYVVVTSVDRDDLPDGGASAFSETIRAIRKKIPACRIEVLIPDFSGNTDDLQTVLNAQPNVLNHNIETVERLYRTARPAGRYKRALGLIEKAKQYAPDIPTKSGLMVGLGEQWQEILDTLYDLRKAGCDLLTIGQYLRPTAANLPVSRYYTPEEFATLKTFSLQLGFNHVEAGPLVRSSYHAREQADFSAP